MPAFLIAAQNRADAPFNQLADKRPVWADLTALDEAMREAGVFVFSRGLESPDAGVSFVVRPGGEVGEVSVTERAGAYGPSTLAGMWIIDCADIDRARDWSRRCAIAHRCDVELRPFQPHVSDYLEPAP